MYNINMIKDLCLVIARQRRNQEETNVKYKVQSNLY